MMFLERIMYFFNIFPVVISASKPMKMAKTDFRGILCELWPPLLCLRSKPKYITIGQTFTGFADSLFKKMYKANEVHL